MLHHTLLLTDVSVGRGVLRFVVGLLTRTVHAQSHIVRKRSRNGRRSMTTQPAAAQPRHHGRLGLQPVS
eukprot:11423037-Prorocentrum_lima.AAC.1